MAESRSLKLDLSNPPPLVQLLRRLSARWCGAGRFPTVRGPAAGLGPRGQIGSSANLKKSKVIRRAGASGRRSTVQEKDSLSLIDSRHQFPAMIKRFYKEISTSFMNDSPGDYPMVKISDKEIPHPLIPAFQVVRPTQHLANS